MPEENVLFSIREARASDKLNKLKLDQAEGSLSAFLQRSSARYSRLNIAKTYVCVQEPDENPARVWGFVTILASEVNLLRELEGIDEYPEGAKHGYPAVKIARLAVDKKYRHQGLGRSLMELAIGMVRAEIMPRIGCRLIILDANPPAISFYKRLGFRLIDGGEGEMPPMFLDLQRT